MAKKDPDQSARPAATRASAPVEELLLAALERGDDTLETGRYLVTFKDAASADGSAALGARGMRVADARDFDNQATALEAVGDADAVVFPEIGVALVGGGAFRERGMSVYAEVASDSPIEVIEPEYFVFAQERPPATVREFVRRATYSPGSDATPGDRFAPRGGIAPAPARPDSVHAEYLRGFARAADAIARDLGDLGNAALLDEEDPLVLGATWGLIACKVPASVRSGVGIKVAVLDTGMDLGHPDFAGRPIVTNTFVGQPVQDLNSHGTHTMGTACGPLAPAGTTPRYGIAHRALMHCGKVLSNAGSGSTASVLAGINWAIANRCVVISMSLGSQAPVQAAYTAAGQAALNNGCLIVAAAGNAATNTGSPANSPTIMAVASLDPGTLAPSSYSDFGKIEIAAPGRDVFSSVPRPTRYGTKSGTSMATPHVTGCAALWAETSPTLRGLALWRKLQATARHLPYPASRVGAGLVQAP